MRGTPEQQDAYVKRVCETLCYGMVVGVGATADGYPMMTVKCSDGKNRIVFAMRDPEGNGPGDFMVITPKKQR